MIEKTVQDFLIEDLLEEDNETNETVELFKYMSSYGTHLSNQQIKALFLLKEEGLDDLADFAFIMKKHTVPTKVFYTLLDKLTLADRIKGNAKLSHLLKANANPANTALRPEDLQAKGLSRSEIDKF